MSVFKKQSGVWKYTDNLSVKNSGVFKKIILQKIV